jgi:O-antigen/teichoic acid export membrane protein
MKDLIRKIRSIASDPLARGAALLFVGSFFVNVASYVFNLVIGRMLGPVQYGEYLALITIVYLLSIPFNTAQTIVIKYVSQLKAKNEIGNIKGLLVMLTKYVSILTILVAIGIILAAPLLLSSLKIDNFYLIILTALTFASFNPPAILVSAFNGLEKYVHTSVLSGGAIILRIILAIVFIQLGLSVAGVFLAIIMGSLVFYIASWDVLNNLLVEQKEKRSFIAKSIGFFRRLLSPTDKSLSSLKQDIVKFTLPTTLAVIGIAALTQVDIVLVKAFFSPYEAGIYSSLAIIGKAIPFFTIPLLTALFPQLVAKVTKGENFLKPFYAVLAIISGASFALSIGYFLFPETVIIIFFGEKYLSAVPYVGLFGLFQTSYAVMNAYVTFFLAIGKTNLASHALIAAALQIILISLFHTTLQQVIGISAAVCGLFVVYYTVCTLHLAYSTKKSVYER